MPTFELHTPIRGDLETIFAALTDLSRFGDWNTVIPSGRGDLAPGSRLDLRMRGPGGRLQPFRPVLLELEAPRRMVLEATIGGRALLTMVHTFELAGAPGEHHLRQHWLATGALAYLLWPLLRRQMASFERMATDLDAWLFRGRSGEGADSRQGGG